MPGTAPPPSISAAAFASELVKLLVQVAWADHDVAPAEAAALIEFARLTGLAPAELSALGDMLSGKAPLAPPNLGLLRQRRTDVLRAVKDMLLSDLKIAEEEEEILAQISALLS
jgi:uncharacterized tellurite resistance protein B-like protein